MSRVISFRDLLRIPSLSKYTEIELLSIDKDPFVNAALAQLGFDIQQPILYVPSKHRDMAGDVGVGFRAVGEINNDPIYLNSRICPLIERLIWAARKDPSLARELTSLMGHSVNLTDDAIEEDNSDFTDDDIDPEYEIISMQLKVLTEIRDDIRGNPYNHTGNLKTPKEYQK